MGSGQPSWDDDFWRERDTVWRAGCRWLQGWWRETQLGLPAGPLWPPEQQRARRRERPVTSRLPLDVGWDANYLSEEAADAARRLAATRPGGLVDEDRLRRDLLSSQPLCVNLFGFLQHRGDLLGCWLEGLLDVPGPVEVDEVRLEWAPPPAQHLGGGSAFDGMIVYHADGTRGFVAVETKYSEHLPDQAPRRVRDVYVEYTRQHPGWRSGAAERLAARATRQLWLNTLLAQSVLDRGDESFDQGVAVVLCCAADVDAVVAARAVAGEQQPRQVHDRVVSVAAASYEGLLATIPADDVAAGWADRMRARYVDTSPVAHKLSPRDPRRTIGDDRQPDGEGRM